jgi:hypothetical protein
MILLFYAGKASNTISSIQSNANTIKLQLNDVTFGNGTKWAVTGVSFGKTGADNSADNTRK